MCSLASRDGTWTVCGKVVRFLLLGPFGPNQKAEYKEVLTPRRPNHPVDLRGIKATAITLASACNYFVRRSGRGLVCGCHRSFTEVSSRFRMGFIRAE